MKDMFTLPDNSAPSSHPLDCINVSVFLGHILERIIQFHLTQNLVHAHSWLWGPVSINSRQKVVLVVFHIIAAAFIATSMFPYFLPIPTACN